MPSFVEIGDVLVEKVFSKILDDYFLYWFHYYLQLGKGVGLCMRKQEFLQRMLFDWLKLTPRYWSRKFFQNVFRSAEPKAQVSYPNHNLSFVCRCRRQRHLSVVNFSHFLLLQNHWANFNQTQSIFGWSGLKFVQMKDPVLFQGENITK